MDQLIHAVVATEVMEVLMISLCLKVMLNHFSKNDWKNHRIIE